VSPPWRYDVSGSFQIYFSSVLLTKGRKGGSYGRKEREEGGEIMVAHRRAFFLLSQFLFPLAEKGRKGKPKGEGKGEGRGPTHIVIGLYCAKSQ